MNPFTRHLLDGSGRPELGPFVQAWDAMESMVIRIYRAGAAGPGDETQYNALKQVLTGQLGVWGAPLETLWRAAAVAGQRDRPGARSGPPIVPGRERPIVPGLERPDRARGEYGLWVGRPAERNPFEEILGRPTASAFVGDWGAMQTLPAARQALNSLLQRGQDLG
jgi:hypothetical protein